MSIHALEMQRGRVVQGQADQEGFLEEKRIRLHWQTIRMFCFSSPTQCFFPTSLPQSLGQSLLGLSNPVIPSGFPGPWELGQTACTRPCPREPGLSVWLRVSFPMRSPRDKPGPFRMKAAYFLFVIESHFSSLNFLKLQHSALLKKSSTPKPKSIM